jgi:hypothetical protein
MFTNPLDKIRVASPCKAGWDQMFGDERRRFCGECRMNVYNLSEMTRTEAESLLIRSEGRLCVRFYRRRDGTVITRDCPVGWKAVKKRVSRMAVALSSLLATFFAGVFSLRGVESIVSALPIGDVPPIESKQDPALVPFIIGEAEPYDAVDGQVDLSEFRQAKGQINRYTVVGRLDYFEPLDDAAAK